MFPDVAIVSSILGALGALFFGICALPQVIKVWRTGDTESLSLLFLIFWLFGEIFMWSYIILDNMEVGVVQYPLHANYFFNFLMLLYLLYKKVR